MALITVNLLFVWRKRGWEKENALSKSLRFVARSLRSHKMPPIVGGKMFNRGTNEKPMARGANKARCKGLANFL